MRPESSGGPSDHGPWEVDATHDGPASGPPPGGSRCAPPAVRRAAAPSYTWDVSAPVSPAEGAAAPAVAIDGLVMRYGDKVAVDELSLTVERATITAVLGPNGAGKTTTLETAEGYRTPAGRHGPGARARPGPRPAVPCSPASA